VQVSGAEQRGDHRWWARLRAGFLLALLLTGLGVAMAAVIGLAALGAAAVLDQALG